jgi:hypothetical protein
LGGKSSKNLSGEEFAIVIAFRTCCACPLFISQQFTAHVKVFYHFFHGKSLAIVDMNERRGQSTHTLQDAGWNRKQDSVGGLLAIMVAGTVMSFHGSPLP